MAEAVGSGIGGDGNGSLALKPMAPLRNLVYNMDYNLGTHYFSPQNANEVQWYQELQNHQAGIAEKLPPLRIDRASLLIMDTRLGTNYFHPQNADEQKWYDNLQLAREQAANQKPPPPAKNNMGMILLAVGGILAFILISER